MSWLERRALVKIFGGGKLWRSQYWKSVKQKTGSEHTEDCQCPGRIISSALDVRRGETWLAGRQATAVGGIVYFRNLGRNASRRRKSRRSLCIPVTQRSEYGIKVERCLTRYLFSFCPVMARVVMVL